MDQYFVYAIGAALVDTEITADDHDLGELGIEKGTMTLVDESRQRVIKKQARRKAHLCESRLWWQCR